jgi:hypothetical protein
MSRLEFDLSVTSLLGYFGLIWHNSTLVEKLWVIKRQSYSLQWKYRKTLKITNHILRIIRVHYTRHYQIFWEVVGLERGSLSLVSTTEKLLERKSSGSGLKNVITAVGDPPR